MERMNKQSRSVGESIGRARVSARRWRPVTAALPILLALCLPAQAARIKDIAQVDGARDNQLIGFGLVGGLAATGDDPKSAPYTAEAIANLLGSQGFTVDPKLIKVKNFAAVMVTADLPAFLSGGDRLDVTLSAIGTAKSLASGVLYQTLLKGADGKVYAVAQGQVSLGATAAGGGGGRSGAALTVGRIPGGALVEAEVPSTLLKDGGALRLNLAHPDFSTASAMAGAVNAKLGDGTAWAEDGGTVVVDVPDSARLSLVDFISVLENIEVEASLPAKLVINQRTGTVVMGSDVSILPVCVTHKGMTLTFGESLSQAGEGAPAPDSAVPPIAPAPGEESPGALLLPEEWKLAPTTAQKAAEGLGRLKLEPEDIVAIFEALDAAGALQGELEVI